MVRNMTCILCPRGCTMTVKETDGALSVIGNSCPKGEGYAIAEVTNPVRTVTSTVRVSNREDTMVSVRTERPIPKGNMMDVMAQLREVTVCAPVKQGDVILQDVFGVRVVATKSVD